MVADRRSDIRYGSGDSKPDRRRGINGHIGEVGAFKARCGLFAAGAWLKRRCYEFPTAEKDFILLQPAVHLSRPTHYINIPNLRAT
jgi:hypothetical protein